MSMLLLADGALLVSVAWRGYFVRALQLHRLGGGNVTE